MKCRRCKAPAVIDVRRHNAAFCGECFLRHCREQVRRAIEQFDMIRPGERVLVAVSGGKDSLAAWDLLAGLGFPCDGLYLGLGIGGDGDYSKTSGDFARAFAASRGAHLAEIDLSTEYGYGIPQAAATTRRAPCGVCGLSKRHLFNQAALDGGYDVLATGHNLDDEAAVLLGNVLRWDGPYLGRQYPVLPEAAGFVRKVKPLVRLSEREMAAYCVLSGIDYIVDECPMAEGNRHLAYKEMLNDLEQRSPGAKASFLFSFWERGHARFAGEAESERTELTPCAVCGSPTPGDVCAFCRLVERAGGNVT
ncbi:MAG: TIGR00269 family protein [Acidimicrobiia bacterium]